MQAEEESAAAAEADADADDKIEGLLLLLLLLSYYSRNVATPDTGGGSLWTGTLEHQHYQHHQQHSLELHLGLTLLMLG